MIGLMKFCEMTRKKLDRELKEQEIDFIKWVYEKHKKETEDKIES